MMRLGGAAQLAELVSHDGGFGDGRPPDDSRSPPLQFAANPLAICLAQAQILVVERAQQPTAYQACRKPDRGDQRDGGTDRGALAPAAFADLLSLKVAVLVQD